MQPLVLGLGVGIGIGGGSRLDVDAQVYITAIEGDGVTVTGAQKVYLSDLYVGAKAIGAYTALKRFHLPVWGVAAANARCLVSATSGTFSGGVTHGAGYITGNGTTGFFDVGSDPATLGLSISSAWMGALWTNGSGNSQAGSYQASGTTLLLVHLYSALPDVLRSEICGSTRRYTDNVTTNANGIFSANRRSGVTRHRQLISSGLDVNVDRTDTDAGTIPTNNFYWLARNNNGTADQLFNATRHGAMWIGTGVAGDIDEDFSALVKTAWEGITGLSLP